MIKKVALTTGEHHPYISGQALRRYLRDTLVEQGVVAPTDFSPQQLQADEKAPIITEGKPARYFDDDIFGFTHVVKKETRRRESPLRVSAVLDLWRITKLKAREDETVVVVRELLFRPAFAFYYVPREDSGITVEHVAVALGDPVYASCLGRSDELAFPRDIRIVTLTESSPDGFYHCTLLPFAYTSRVGWRLEVAARADELARPPEVVRMPVRFRVLGGVREADWGEFTVVYRMGLKLEDRRGWRDGEWNFFLF